MPPQIDVSELLSDPDFVGPVSLVTRVPTVNSLGENSTRDNSHETVGSVQPANYKTILRAPEALREENLMSFWVKAKIETTGAGKYPSILVFQGTRFEVKTVADWSSWGAGWSEGLCVAMRPA